MSIDHRVIVLGAGLSGIGMGIQLQKKGIEDFIILEKNAEVGGTWRENTYPGVACDVPSHVYSFSFELNPNWQGDYSAGADIQNYAKHCVAKYHLSDKIKHHCEVVEMRYQQGAWQVELADGKVLTTQFVVSALGGLHLPKHADIKGIDTFAGDTFHTAQWNDDCDLADKKVAIIGTGASAAQVLPEIADSVESVTVYQRTPGWILPKIGLDSAINLPKLFNAMPWLMRLYRWALWLFMDVRGSTELVRDSLASRSMRKSAEAHLEASVPDVALRKKLTPDYVPGCKRRIVSDDYLTAFSKNNVHLCTDAIAEIDRSDIVLATGERHLALFIATPIMYDSVRKLEEKEKN